MKNNSFVIGFLLAIISFLIIIVSAFVIIFIAAKIDQTQQKTTRQTIYHVGSNNEFSLRDGMVRFPTKLQQCRIDGDCVVIGNHCGGCSIGTEINKTHINYYSEQFYSLCDIYYEGGQIVMCNVYQKPRQAKCIEGICSS